jgi:hypothetical protein
MPAKKKKSTKVRNLKPAKVKSSKAASVRGGATSYSGAEGKATFSDLNFTHVIDKASSVL